VVGWGAVCWGIVQDLRVAARWRFAALYDQPIESCRADKALSGLGWVAAAGRAVVLQGLRG